MIQKKNQYNSIGNTNLSSICLIKWRFFFLYYKLIYHRYNNNEDLLAYKSRVNSRLSFVNLISSLKYCKFNVFFFFFFFFRKSYREIAISASFKRNIGFVYSFNLIIIFHLWNVYLIYFACRRILIY